MKITKGTNMIRNITLALLLSVTSIVSATETSTALKEATVQRREIGAEKLKSMYDEKIPMIVVDARTKQYFDGTILPSALWIPADVDNDKITTTLPDKHSLIVVYCYSSGCPASGWLYDKLIALGYTNVHDFHGGLVEWTKKGYPTLKQ